MRRSILGGAVAALLAAGSVVPTLAEPPKKAPEPPTTPLPAFENPLYDAKVGEQIFFRVRDLQGEWTKYFLERVLARDGEFVLIETVLTDPKGEKTFEADTDPRSTGWKPVAKELKLGPTQSWIKERQRDEVVVVGDPPTAAVRAVRRVIEEPDPTKPQGINRQREVWYSHDVPATGRVKMFPAHRGGERMAISWDRTVPAAECAERAKRYPREEPKKDEGGMSEGGDGGKVEPGMGEPGMGEGGMEEPGMTEPGMDEPGMDEPGMDSKD